MKFKIFLTVFILAAITKVNAQNKHVIKAELSYAS